MANAQRPQGDTSAQHNGELNRVPGNGKGLWVLIIYVCVYFIQTSYDTGLESNKQLPLRSWCHVGFTFQNRSKVVALELEQQQKQMQQIQQQQDEVMQQLQQLRELHQLRELREEEQRRQQLLQQQDVQLKQHHHQLQQQPVNYYSYNFYLNGKLDIQMHVHHSVVRLYDRIILAINKYGVFHACRFPTQHLCK
jgi:hypothetical protein